MGEYTLHAFKREDHLLQEALKIHKIHMNEDRSYFNILYAIGKERDETQVHSKIIYFLRFLDSFSSARHSGPF